MPAEVTDPTGVYFFTITLGDVSQAGMFRECSGFESSHTVVENRSSDGRGITQVQKFPGQMQWGNITLKRGVDSENQLWTWRQKIVEGKITEARTDGQIDVVDSEGNVVVTYKFVRGWPCRYSAPAITAGGDEVLVEEIEIAHEGFERV
jgi:phage tail-like protein